MEPKLITDGEFQKLINAVHGRDRLIIELLAATGMRIKELTTITKGHVDLEERVIRLNGHITKTSEPRDVVLPEEVFDHLEEYIHKIEGERLFPISTTRARQIIHKAAIDAGIQSSYKDGGDGRTLYKVSPHSLRSYHAVRALECGVPLNAVQKQLGHKSIKTTSRYLEAGLNHRKKNYAVFHL